MVQNPQPQAHVMTRGRDITDKHFAFKNAGRPVLLESITLSYVMDKNWVGTKPCGENGGGDKRWLIRKMIYLIHLSPFKTNSKL